MGHNNGTAPGCVAGLGKPGAAPLLVVASGKKARRRAPFKQADIARAVKGVQKAGLPVAAVKVEPGGTILVIPGTPEAVPSLAPNPWDGGDA